VPTSGGLTDTVAMVPSSVPTTRVTASLERLRRATFVVLLLLLIQFALGIAANLYVTVPIHHPGAGASDYFTGSLRSLGWALHAAPIALAAHAALGLLLVLAAAGLIFQAARVRRRLLVAAASLGTGCVIGAGFNGASFLDYAMNVSSLIMALLFALAMLCYLTIIYAIPGRQGGAGTAAG
jgi:hypothetical protein